MKSKKINRLRRAAKTRRNILEKTEVRLSIHRTSTHTYAQVISGDGQKTLAQASTLDKEIRAQLSNTSNVSAAKLVGDIIAKRAKDAGVSRVAFDRSGFKYHGRVKALADAARAGGLEF